MYFIDASTSIRVLRPDDSEQTPKALAVLEGIADSEISGWAAEDAMLEVARILASENNCALERPVIPERLIPLPTRPNLRIEYWAAQLTGPDLCAETGLDDVDCLAIAYAHSHELDVIVRFDRGLDCHAAGMTVEPARVPERHAHSEEHELDRTRRSQH